MLITTHTIAELLACLGGCSRNGVASMLRMLGREEIQNIIAERGKVKVHCDFCNQLYEFDQVDAVQLFTADIILPTSESRH